MASKVTEWRHRTGRSKERRPHGDVNYAALAWSVTKKWYPDLLQNYYEDVKQEIAILVIEAKKKYIKGYCRIKKFGNGRDRVGQKQFGRAVTSRLHWMRNSYGLQRNQSFVSFDEDWDSLRREHHGKS
jgi:hypothetical protein